jgi:hypothetical protein
VSGDYRLTAKRAGFTSREYGQHGWYRAGIPFHVAAGETRMNIRIPLTRSGAISGRVTDTAGEASDLNIVQAIVVSNTSGQRTYRVEQSAITNDLGEYRFFELHPGRYILSATSFGTARLSFFPNIADNRILQLLNIAGQDTAPVFYPGTADSGAAAEIEIVPGASVRGANFMVFPAKSLHVRGSVQVTGASVQLIALTPTPGSPSSVRGAATPAGIFEFSDVAPGEYLLVARSIDKGASVKVNVRDTDVDNLELDLKPGIVVPTHVRIEGRETVAADPAYRFIRFRLKPDPEIAGVPGPAYNTFPDGSVNFDLLPGESNRIALISIPDSPPGLQNIYIESIRMGTHDVLREGLQFNGEENAKIEIVIGTRAGGITGAVLENDQTPSINTTVVLIPDVSRRGIVEAYKTAITDTAGRFQIEAIPPGDYQAFAWDEVDDGEWLNAEFLRRFEGRGAAIHINEGEKTSISLRVIP